MNEFKGPSLRSRLYLLLLVMFIPVGLLIFFTAEEQKEIEKKTIFHGAMMLARAMALDEQQQLDSARDLLMTLADLYGSEAIDADQFNALLDSIGSRSKGYADLGILQRNGRLIAHGRSTVNAPVDFSRQEWFKQSLKQTTLSVGAYGDNRIEGRPVIYVALPVMDANRQVLAVAFAALDLGRVNRTIVEMLSRLPVEAALTLTDLAGGFWRYDPVSDGWSRQQEIPRQLLERISNRRTGILTAQSPEKQSQIYAFAPIESALKSGQAYVILQIPEKKALAASRQAFFRNGVGLVLFLLLATLCVWWSAETFILRRVRQLVQASRGIAAGDLTSRVGDMGGRDELSHLAGVFDDMAAALQQRQLNEQRAMIALQQSREQLRNLASYQQEVREKERIRIAREIHDQLGQSLTILKMDLSWLNRQMADGRAMVREKIDTMFQVIDEALKTMHVVMAELRPVILDDFGLAAAIEWQTEEFQNRTGIACRVDIEDPPPDLSKELSIVVFRIFQELLTNIMRHAQADAVEISLREEQKQLRLRVIDDGRGISQEQINDPGSFGLIGIRERLHPWSGTVDFIGRDGQGTEVTVTLPLQKER